MEKKCSEEWEVVDYETCYDDVEREEKQNWYWFSSSNRMMDAAKKVIMAGVVMSSAPVLLPPLFVVSALAFTMSLPYGVVLASYACTQSLMTRLLPPPPLPLPLLLQLQEEEEEEEEEVKNESIMRIEDLQFGGERDYLEEDQEEEEEEEEEEMRSSSSSSSSEDVDDGLVQVSIEINEALISLTHNVVVDDDDAKQDERNATHVKDVHHKTGAGEQDNLKMAAADGDGDGDGDSLESKKERLGIGLNGDEEKKIWEKINAIRVIVGFKAPRRSSYLEELKALYLFTGIEPPPPPPPKTTTTTTTTLSSTSSLDHFAELDCKLSFLMSVIGLK